MFSKPLCAVFTNKGIKIFSSVINRSLITKCHDKRSNLLVPSKISLVGEPTKRFAESSGRALVRQEPGPVRLGFIPDEWFTFFFPKTGVSGLGTFTFTFSTYLMSKEIYVMEHEYYGGLSMAIMCICFTKYIGPIIAEYLDNELDEYGAAWAAVTANSKKALEDEIKNEEKLQWSSEGRLLLVEAKRENVGLQLEAAYRERAMTAYKETVKRLQYCVIRTEVEKAIIKRNMTSWVVKEVSKALTENIEKESINKCMEDLQELSKTFKGLSVEYPPISSEDDWSEPPPPPPGPPKKPKK